MRLVFILFLLLRLFALLSVRALNARLLTVVIVPWRRCRRRYRFHFSVLSYDWIDLLLLLAFDRTNDVIGIVSRWMYVVIAVRR